MDKRPKRKASGYQTRYAKDDQSKEDKVANLEQVSKKKGKTQWGQYCLIKASIQREKNINITDRILITAKRGLHLPVSKQKTTEK